MCAMLRQLIENQILNLQILVEECDQIIEEGVRLPMAYWRGLRQALRSTAYELHWVLRDVPDDEQLVGYLDGLIYNWVEEVMDLHDRIGECNYAGEHEDAIRLNGSLNAYAHTYREISQIVEREKERSEEDAASDD